MGKCLSGQMSFWANVVWANVLLGKRRKGQMALGKRCMGKCHGTIPAMLKRTILTTTHS
jgi:hypothetical protein